MANNLSNNFCIREDYVSRTDALTFVPDSREYWTPSRIRRSGIYQYYVYVRIRKILEQRQTASFLDIGCGYPTKVVELIQPVTSNITLIDQPSMKPTIEAAFPNFRFIPMNLEQPQNTLEKRFDCVCVSDVVEHLINPNPLMRLIHDLSKPNSVIFISTPERDMQRGRDCLYSPQREHVREWTAAEFAEYVRQCGFQIVEHHLLPRGRLFGLEEKLLPQIGRIYKKRYLSCQLVVCKLS
jgi:SAM-dependent methyltransferase